jgi:hypothetical protein
MPSHRGPLLSLLVASTTLLAQEQTTIGRFLTADGTPIANAVVTFATSRQDVFDALGPARVVTATTDERGTFKVKLQQGDVHSLWALGPAGPAGSWCSPVQEGVVAGNVLELRASERVAPKPLRVTVPKELGAGPFTLEVVTAMRHAPPLRLPLPVDGDIVLPPLPPGQPILRLLDPQGGTVVGWFWPNGSKTQPAAAQRVLVEVVDEAGAPVANARVAALVNSALHSRVFGQTRTVSRLIDAPTTNAEGRSEVVVAEHATVGFVAWTDERHARIAGNRPFLVDGVPQKPGAEKDLDPSRPIRLVARHGPVLRGTLRRGDSPLAGLRVAAEVEGECRREENGTSASTSFAASHVGVTNTQGRFTIPGVARPMRSLRLAWDLGDGVATYPLPRANVPTEPLDLDVAQWPVVTMQLQVEGATPPMHSHFLLWSATAAEGSEPLVLVGERSGRVRARCEPGAWFVFATDGDRCAVNVVDVPAGEKYEIELASQPLASMRGRAVDRTGKPVANALFHIDGWEKPGPVSFAFDAWQQLPPKDVARLQKPFELHITAIHRGLVEERRTDAAGNFSVPLLPMRGCTMSGYLGGILGLRVKFEAAEDLELVLPR